MKLSQVRHVLTGQGLPRYDAPPDIKGRPRPDRAMRITELWPPSTSVFSPRTNTTRASLVTIRTWR